MNARMRIAGTGFREGLFGVREYVEDDVGVAPDLKKKTPIFVNAGLPDIVGLVNLLGVQAWVTQVAEEQANLFVESLLYLGRRVGIAPIEALGIETPHLAERLLVLLPAGALRAVFFRLAIISSVVSKGP